MIRDFLAGRMGVDSVAFVSMSAALVLGQNLAGIVIAIMYAGGNLLEDIAVARAERDLGSLIDRAPRIAHRRSRSSVEDVPRMLRRLVDGITRSDADHYLIRDAQCVIEGIEALVRIHNAQEEDIYEHAMGISN